MSNQLSYGPDKMLVGFWALLFSPPALIWGYLLLNGPASGKALPFLLSMVLLLAPVLFASRFRATFGPTEFVYRRWGPTIRVPYSEIERIEVTNATPITRQAVGAFIVTRCGNRLPFWPKLFPREAVERFFALASWARHGPPMDESGNVELPHVRRELMLYLEELASEDPRSVWRRERSEGLISGVDQVIHYFFDGHDFDDHSIGPVLLNHAELAAIEKLQRALDAVIEAVGVRALRGVPDAADDRFVQHPLWREVTTAADAARRQLGSAS